MKQKQRKNNNFKPFFAPFLKGTPLNKNLRDSFSRKKCTLVQAETHS